MHASNTYIATGGAHYSYDVAVAGMTNLCMQYASLLLLTLLLTELQGIRSPQVKCGSRNVASMLISRN